MRVQRTANGKPTARQGMPRVTGEGVPESRCYNALHAGESEKSSRWGQYLSLYLSITHGTTGRGSSVVLGNNAPVGCGPATIFLTITALPV